MRPTASDARGRLAPVLSLLVALLLPFLGPAAAGAQAPASTGASSDALGAQDGTPLIRLVVSRMTSLAGPGAASGQPSTEALLRVLVEHRGITALTDAELVVETFGRATSRSGLRLALDGGIVRGPRYVERLPVRDGTVEPSDVAAVDVFLPLSRATEAGRSGVYPVQLTLTRGTTIIDRVVTALIHLAETPQNPLETVVVWPIDAAPWTTPTDDRTAFDDEILPGGRIDNLVRSLEAAPNSGIVAAVTPHLLDALVRRATGANPATTEASGEADADPDADPAGAAATDLLVRLRAVLGRLPNAPVAGPYASADLDALVAAGPQMIGIAGELAADGPRRVEGLTDRAPDPSTVLARVPLTPRSLDLLPGDHLLLDFDAVTGPDLSVGPDLPHPVQRLRATSGRVVTASIADPYIAEVVGQPDLAHGTSVAVQRVLAETALIHFEQPGIADRPLLVLPPRGWGSEGRFQHDLAVALTNAPWMQLAGASRHAQVAVGELGEGTLRTNGAHLPTDVAAAIGTTLTSVAAITSTLAPGQATVAGRTVADLDDQLRRATSSWFVDTPSTAVAMVADVAAAVDASYGIIEVPTADTITLLSEQGKIPITLRRTAGDQIEVEVEVRSRGALTWPAGSVQRQRLTAGGTQTLSFDVLARSRGDIPVEVLVRDLTGARILADTTIRVRSTFVSRPALFTTAGVVILLLLLGRLRRRPGRGTDATADDGLSIVRDGGEP